MAVRAYSIRIVALLACLTLAASVPAQAREKEASLPQWALDAANTPTPANAGDASAAVLDDEYLITVDDQNHAVERERYVVRILKPQGRQYSHCVAEYAPDAKLNYFHAWTISSTGQRFQAKDTDFHDEGDFAVTVMQSDEQVRILTPPAGDPGAVVVCETEVHLRPYMDAEDWQIQYPIPIADESMELDLPAGGHFAQSWSHYEQVKPEEIGPNHLRWEVKAMPALDLENMHATPSERGLFARMSVMWGNLAVNGVDNQWRAIGVWQQQLEAHRPDPTPEIAAKAQEVAGSATDLYTKLDRIASYIQNSVRYFVVMRGIGGWQAHYAADIFRNHYGDCKDKTTLLISMLQAVGIRAYYLHVDGDRGVIDPAEPSLNGDHMITAIELPDGDNDPRLMARVKAVSGKTLLIFDPTDETTPVGLVRPDLQGAYGNLADGENSQVLQIPVLSPDSAVRTRTGSFTMAADGSITGDITDVFSGVEAAQARGAIKENSAKDVKEGLEIGLSTDLPNLTVKGFEFHQQDQLDKPISLVLHITDASYARSAGSLLLVRPRVTGSDAADVPYLAEKNRTIPIEIGHPARLHDAFDITLPDGYSVDETPDPVSVDMDFASYHSSVTAKGNVIHYEREYVVRQLEIPANKVDDLRRLQSAIVFDEKGAVVLKKQ